MCKGSEREGKKEMKREKGIEINPAVCDFARKCNQLFSQLGYLWISFVNRYIWKLSLRQEWGWGEGENNLSGSSNVSLVKSTPRAMNSPTLWGCISKFFRTVHREDIVSTAWTLPVFRHSGLYFPNGAFWVCSDDSSWTLSPQNVSVKAKAI